MNWYSKHYTPLSYICLGHMHALYQRCTHSLARAGYRFDRQQDAFNLRWIHLGLYYGVDHGEIPDQSSSACVHMNPSHRLEVRGTIHVVNLRVGRFQFAKQVPHIKVVHWFFKHHTQHLQYICLAHTCKRWLYSGTHSRGYQRCFHLCARLVHHFDRQQEVNLTYEGSKFWSLFYV